MAASSLLTLIDDIAAVLDDVAVMSKVAAQKTAGVVGDDLALNAEQVTGVQAEREIPVVWAVGKGAMLNKVILVPIALLISSFASWLITPLLMIGGGFLAYEGFHKVWHKLVHKDEEEAEKTAHKQAVRDTSVDLVALEKQKIRGAIRTDFILSAELIVIALGTMASEPLFKQVLALSFIAVALNVGVYGLVAAIVKIDDLGASLKKKGGFQATIGQGLLVGAPIFMKILGIAGTIAMFLVGGGILSHGIHAIAEAIQNTAQHAGSLDWLVQTLLEGLVGVIAGGLINAIVAGVSKVLPKKDDGEATPKTP